MRMIAKDDHSALYQDGDNWVMKTGNKIKTVSHKKFPNWDDSCIEKYGFYRVDSWEDSERKTEKAALLVAQLALRKVNKSRSE